MKSTERLAALRMAQAAVASLRGWRLRRVRYRVLTLEDHAGNAGLEDWDDGFLHTATMGVEFETEADTVFFTWRMFSWSDDPGDYALLADESIAGSSSGWVDVSNHVWWSALVGETPVVSHCWYAHDPRDPALLWPNALRLSLGDVVTWVILGQAATTGAGQATGAAWVGGDEVFVTSDGQLDALGLAALRSFAAAPVVGVES